MIAIIAFWAFNAFIVIVKIITVFTLCTVFGITSCAIGIVVFNAAFNTCAFANILKFITVTGFGAYNTIFGIKIAKCAISFGK